MTTRSSCKCCITCITLDPEDAMQVQGRVMSRQLMAAWTEVFPDTCPDGFGSEVDIKANQLTFIESQMNRLLTIILSGTYVSVSYLKVLIAWHLVLDSRSAFETLTRALNVCNQVDPEDSIEVYINFFTNVLSGILLLPDVSKIIDLIDEQKNTRMSLEDNLNAAIWRYSIGGR